MTGDSAAALHLEPVEDEVEEIEIRLLIEGVRLCYGYDFQEYSPAAVRRGLMAAMAREGTRTVSAYQDRILHDASAMQRFLSVVGVNVTSMFREPGVLACIRNEVVPLLNTYPSVRIWIAGCATGEEAYSLAILLAEADLLRRCNLYATDLNEDMLDVARLGTYPLDKMRRYAEAYLMAGGGGSLSDYYSVNGRSARLKPEITSTITWSRHNLASDGSFNDFHLIICANVLIYFGPSLQQRVYRLFYDSLVRGGFLALGRRESLLYCADRDHYEQVCEGVNLYRKARW